MPPQGDGCLGGLAALPLFPRRGQKEGPARKPPEGRAGVVRGTGWGAEPKSWECRGASLPPPHSTAQVEPPRGHLCQGTGEQTSSLISSQPRPNPQRLSTRLPGGRGEEEEGPEEREPAGSPPGGRGPSRNLKRTRSWQGSLAWRGQGGTGSPSSGQPLLFDTWISRTTNNKKAEAQTAAGCQQSGAPFTVRRGAHGTAVGQGRGI